MKYISLMRIKDIIIENMRNMKSRLAVLVISLAFLMGGGGYVLKAQGFAIKSNLLYDATVTLNLGVEATLAPRWTFDFSGNYNPWNLPSGKLIKHAMIQPEFRYWFCDRFSRHFIGFHAIGGIYNIGNIPNNLRIGSLDLSSLTNYRFEGWGVGAGIAYGYAFILSEHWNLELEVGAGYVYTENDKFQCIECAKRLEDNIPYHYFGPTKANVGLVYVF
jgi:hypothetical protein